MMRVPRFDTLLVGNAVAALVVLIASPLPAQQGAVITGRVSSTLGDPLGGASVVVANTNFGAAATANGTYTITIPAEAVRGQQVVLTARYIGYRPATRTITLEPGTHEQSFELQPDPFRLDEVVVTGVGEATAAKKVPFAVGRLTAEQLQEVPGSSALVALQGKVAAVRLIPTSSQPGGEVALRLRGATSIGGTQDPLFIVDGVITLFGLADIAPEDVERVEVIKGAAASSLYGSNAANGVVQVFTKRGRSLPDGTLRVTSRVEGGVNNMPKRMQFSRSHAWQIDANGDYILSATGARITELDRIADNPFPVYYDHWDAVVNAGQFWTGYVSVGQRRGTTNFNASVQNTRNEGVIFGLGGYTRQNFRLNLDQQLRSNIDASFSTFYGTSTNGRAEEGQGTGGQGGGPFFGLMFLQPDVDITACCNPDGSPYKAQVPLSGDVANDNNPLYELANRKITQDRNRFSGSGRVRWRMLDWLSGEGGFAYDQESQAFKDLYPFGFLTASGTATQGRLVKESSNNQQYNTGATLSAVRRFGDITSTTKVGVAYEDQKNKLLSDSAGTLIVARVPEFGGADQNFLRIGSREETIRSQSYFATTAFDVKDRYIVDALVRRDGSSLFGPQSRWSTYYRVSGAWRVTEDLKIPALDEWRLRGSYGTAGLRPKFDDQYEILAVTPGGFSTEILGNPLLKPARSAELEVGTNLEFGSGRYSVEYTYAQKKTTDQILLVDLSAVARSTSGTGGFQQQWQNTGSLRSKTHELTFATRLINNRNTTLTLNIVGDRTRQVITEWDLPERLYTFQQMPAAFFLGKGSNLGVLYGNRWVRNIDDLYADPAKAAASGVGQAWSRDTVRINEDGYVVRKDTYGTPDERAIKYTFCKRADAVTGSCLETSQTVQIGDANPDFNLSFGATLNHKRFVVNALLDWSQGGDLYNGTRQWAFQATRDRVQDQAGTPAAARKALAYYAVGFYNGLDPNDFFVENGSYAKLKELSVNYTFVNEQLQRVGFLRGVHELRLGFIARNLFTITNYSGLDPEVSGLFGDPFQVRMDWFQYPQFRTFSAVVEIAF
ncbi:MAG: SusC/RagA family TonB-linked outer membrane protein [Gemmatimonadales bacterium]